jgi:hypothetical protein
VIPLEGRAIAGLDEFMLRLGHLSAICRIATTDGGSAYRFERAIASKFSELVPVPAPLLPAFARYIREKGLCPVEAIKSDKKESADETAEYRYPELRVIDPAGPNETVVSDRGEIVGQWQDVSLSHPNVPSKVGAISFGGKKGSKTGLSHLLDWGGFLGLFNAAGSLTNFGQLIGKYADIAHTPQANPYVLGPEKLIFGYLTAREDFDVFASLVSFLATETEVLRKADAMRLYMKAITGLSDRAEKSRDLSQGRRQGLFSLWRDVKPKRPGDDQITSTAWHRVAARLENFVDLGLLRKEVFEEYQYKYRITENLHRAARALGASTDAGEWIDGHLVDILTSTTASDEPIAIDDLESHLVKLLSVLSRAMSPLPLDVIANGLAALSLHDGAPITFGTARRSLENYAVQHPERARLSAGSTRRAEYISIDVASLSRGRR